MNATPGYHCWLGISLFSSSSTLNLKMPSRIRFAPAAVATAACLLLSASHASAQCPADYTCQTGLKGYDETVAMTVQIAYGNFNLPGVGMVYGGSGYDCDGVGGSVKPVFCCVVKGSAAAGSGQVMTRPMGASLSNIHPMHACCCPK